jgi:hypothetical protein
VTKVEWLPGELFPRVGSIVTNLSRRAERLVAFYNQRQRRRQSSHGQPNAIEFANEIIS